MRCNTIQLKVENLSLHHTPTPNITRAYLLGALHDSSEAKYTFRLCQKNLNYIELCAQGIKNLGFKCWVYKEGKDRDLYIAEFSKRVLYNFSINTPIEKIDYIRGYFDSEGGVPRNFSSRYYIYFAQKNKEDLLALRSYLIDLRISCGNIHNPSKLVDPNYFRFYILRESWEKFGNLIGSYHPVKSIFVRKKI